MMNTATEPHSLSRRQAMLRALKSGVTAAVVSPVIVEATSSAAASQTDPEFVPENDYPFFGLAPDTRA
jgi:hypothetical protein